MLTGKRKLEDFMKEKQAQQVTSERLVAKWKSARKFPETSVGHECTRETCTFETIVADCWFGCVETGAVHQKGDLEAREELKNLERILKEPRQRQEEDNDNAAIEDWKDSRRPFPSTDVGHVCSREGCSFDAIVPNKWYGCKDTGVIHRCGDECNRQVLTPQSDFVCELSGIVLDRMYVDPWTDGLGNSSVAVESRSSASRSHGLRRKYVNKAVRTSALASQGGVNGIVRDVLKRLLVDTTVGVDHEALQKEMRLQISKAVCSYHKKCVRERQWPIMYFARMETHKIRTDRKYAEREPCSNERLEYYVSNVCALWSYLEGEFPDTRHTKLHIEKFTLGAIYLFQHGITIKSTVVAEPDSWLLQHLPEIQKLEKMEFGKGCVTSGRNSIFIAIRERIYKEKHSNSQHV